MKIKDWVAQFDQKTPATKFLSDIGFTSGEIFSQEEMWDYVRQVFRQFLYVSPEEYPFHVVNWEEAYQKLAEELFDEYAYAGKVWYMSKR